MNEVSLVQIIFISFCVGLGSPLGFWIANKMLHLDKKKCAYGSAAGAMIGCLIAKIIMLVFF